MKKLSLGLIVFALCGTVQAKLQSPTPEEQAAAAAAKEKTAWSDKVAAYKLCLAQDRVASHYMKTRNVTKGPSPEVPACSDPGAFVPSAQQAAQVGVADAKPVPEAGKPAPPPAEKK